MSTRQELLDFRDRIRNWARVYRDRLVRNESNLMWVIRALKAHEEGQSEVRRPPADIRDADVIDHYVCALRTQCAAFERVFKVLKIEYLTKYSVEDFESQYDERKANHVRARYAGVFYRDYDEKLMMAETLLMNFAKKNEQGDKKCDLMSPVR